MKKTLFALSLVIFGSISFLKADASAMTAKTNEPQAEEFVLPGDTYIP